MNDCFHPSIHPSIPFHSYIYPLQFVTFPLKLIIGSTLCLSASFIIGLPRTDWSPLSVVSFSLLKVYACFSENSAQINFIFSLDSLPIAVLWLVHQMLLLWKLLCCSTLYLRSPRDWWIYHPTQPILSASCWTSSVNLTQFLPSDWFTTHQFLLFFGNYCSDSLHTWHTLSVLAFPAWQNLVVQLIPAPIFLKSLLQWTS